MWFRSASPSPRIRSESRFALAISTVTSLSAVDLMRCDCSLPCALKLGRLALTFRLHPPVDRLAVGFGQIGAPYAHVHDLDAKIANIVVDLLDRLLHELRRAYCGRHR